jgi:UDP-3-O-[3-hydroxymyristoyl] N-acetylglucosamine deacetylase/3-hydroxyacyl-[acyl-carrier-protein] dehydratase
MVGMKNVTMNENFFVGHFPEAPVMPGVLLLRLWHKQEVFSFKYRSRSRELFNHFMKIDNVKFKHKFAWRYINFKCDLITPIRRGICHASQCLYNGKLVAEAELMAQIAKNSNFFLN